VEKLFHGDVLVLLFMRAGFIILIIAEERELSSAAEN
jgi:hypothetical protein